MGRIWVENGCFCVDFMKYIVLPLYAGVVIAHLISKLYDRGADMFV